MVLLIKNKVTESVFCLSLLSAMTREMPLELYHMHNSYCIFCLLLLFHTLPILMIIFEVFLLIYFNIFSVLNFLGAG